MRSLTYRANLFYFIMPCSCDYYICGLTRDVLGAPRQCSALLRLTPPGCAVVFGPVKAHMHLLAGQ